MSENSVNIDLNGHEFALPIKKGTIGPDVVDIGTLYKNTGAFTYDPGFTSTASCESLGPLANLVRPPRSPLASTSQPSRRT